MATEDKEYKISTWRIFFRAGNVGNIYVTELHQETQTQVYHDQLLSLEGMMTMVFANSEEHDVAMNLSSRSWHSMGTAGGPDSPNLLKQNAQMYHLSKLEVLSHPKDIILKVENRVVKTV